MQMRADIQITTMIKALTDVVIPALPTTNKLAVEQAQLIAGMLNLLKFQLPLQFQFDRDELQRMVKATADLKTQSTADSDITAALASLDGPRQRATEILSRCQGDPAELHAAILDMRTALCTLIDTSATSADDRARTHIETILLSMSKDQLLRDRALMKPQHWEADHEAVPDINILLSQ